MKPLTAKTIQSKQAMFSNKLAILHPPHLLSEFSAIASFRKVFHACARAILIRCANASRAVKPSKISASATAFRFYVGSFFQPTIKPVFNLE
jgi:hypothetical protein